MMKKINPEVMKGAQIVPPYGGAEDYKAWQEWAKQTHSTFRKNDALSEKSARKVFVNSLS